MANRPPPNTNNRETVEDLEACITNVERGIFALEMDIYRDEDTELKIEQLYNLKKLYEADLRALKRKR